MLRPFDMRRTGFCGLSRRVNWRLSGRASPVVWSYPSRCRIDSNLRILRFLAQPLTWVEAAGNGHDGKLILYLTSKRAAPDSIMQPVNR